MNTTVNNEKPAIEEEVLPVKKRNVKENVVKKPDEVKKQDEESKIEMDDVRRMVKKAIARNKLSS